MLIEKFNEADYGNPKVAALIKAILDLESEFVNRSQGNVMNSMLITTGSSFGVSANVSALYGAQPAKITKPVVFKDPHPKKTYKDPHCATCGQSATVGASTDESASRSFDNKTQDIMESLKGEQISSSREILNMFNSDVDMLRLAAKELGIIVNNNDKAVTLAKKIYETYERNLAGGR